MAVFVFVRLEKTKVSYHVHADNLEQAVKSFNDGGGEIKSDERQEVLEQWVYDDHGNDLTAEAAYADDAYQESFALEAVLERQAAEKSETVPPDYGAS